MASKKARKVYSLDEKAAILAELGTKSVPVVAKARGVAVQTIYLWKKQAGLSGTNGAPKRRGKKAKARRKLSLPARLINGASNGRAANGTTGTRLDLLHESLSHALQQVDAMRTAFKDVFGGGGGKMAEPVRRVKAPVKALS